MSAALLGEQSRGGFPQSGGLLSASRRAQGTRPFGSGAEGDTFTFKGEHYLLSTLPFNYKTPPVKNIAPFSWLSERVFRNSTKYFMGCCYMLM